MGVIVWILKWFALFLSQIRSVISTYVSDEKNLEDTVEYDCDRDIRLLSSKSDAIYIVDETVEHF